MRTRLNHLLYLFLGIFGVQAPSAQAEMFLCFDDPNLAGESDIKGREGCIDVLSFSWGANNPAGVQAPSYTEVSLTKSQDKASPALLLSLNKSQNVGGADIFQHTSCGGCLGDLVFEANLEEVAITSLSDSGSASPPISESITLIYSKLTYCYTEDPGGAAITTCTTISPGPAP